MPEALYLVGAAVTALLGFAWVALGMAVHWSQVHGRDLAPPRALRPVGAAALLLSLALCLAADHPSMAVLVWFMLLAAAAVAVAMTLSTRPHWLRGFWLHRG